MKRISVFSVIFVAIGMIVTSCGKGVSTNVSLKKDVDSAFYAIGVNYGAGLKEGLKTLPGTDGIVNIDAVIAGFVAGMKDDPSLKMNAEEAQAFIQSFVETASIRDAEKTKADGEAFLASNKTKQGVITTESGLQYKVITEGTGKKPTSENNAIVHYTGKLLDGTVFDSSVQRGEPVPFPLTPGALIQGMTEAILIMPVGSKYTIWIPSELAYGEYGNPQGGIKPNSVLEFEVELLGIAEE